MQGFGYKKDAHNYFLLGKMHGCGYEKQGQSANEQVSQATQRASEPNHQASEHQAASQHSRRSADQPQV